MKHAFLAICSLSLISTAMASPDLIRQLTEPEYASENQAPYDDSKTFNSTQTLKLSETLCEEARQLRRLPNPDYPRIFQIEQVCNQTVYVNDQKIVGFEISNESQNRINPRTAQYGSERTYRFEFPLRHSQNIHISITENSGLTSLMSHDLLETSIVLFPRKVIPSMELIEVGDKVVRRIQLATTETIDVDARSGEIIDGVLEESAMDMNPSRHARRFAGVNYTGRGLMIRVDRRAGTPEHIYTQSFNQNERIKDATVTYRGKTCYVPKNLIWANAINPDLSAYVMYASDQELLDKAINPKCGWNLTTADLE